MKALRKHIKLMTRLIEGEFGHNELSGNDFRIRMECTNHGFWGDISFDFYHQDQHVLTYEAQLTNGSAKPGTYTNQSDRVSEAKAVAQFKAALKELQYPITEAKWTVVNEKDKSIRYEGTDDFLARLNYAGATAEKIAASLWFRPAGHEDGDMMEWNCDLDTGEFDGTDYDSTSYSYAPKSEGLGYMQGRGAV